MIVVVDIDGTICYTPNNDYEKSIPYPKAIERINQHYYQGDTVIYYTSRGGTSGIDWTELTKKQLKEWGCLYHELRMNKLSYDVWYDDKAVNAIENLR